MFKADVELSCVWILRRISVSKCFKIRNKAETLYLHSLHALDRESCEITGELTVLTLQDVENFFVFQAL